MNFTIHTQDSAPTASQPLLQNSIDAFGTIPNLHAVMAEAPSVLEAYQVLHKLFQQTHFDAEELTVIWQTVNVEHQCHYCVPAHTAIAQMMKVDEAVINALRNQSELPTRKLQTLHLTTLALVRKRGQLSAAELTTFYETGYKNNQLLEIILGISQKVMSNYVNQLAQTPVDKIFESYSW